MAALPDIDGADRFCNCPAPYVKKLYVEITFIPGQRPLFNMHMLCVMHEDECTGCVYDGQSYQVRHLFVQ